MPDKPQTTKPAWARDTSRAERLVTNEMRQAAIDYWTSVHTKSPLIPIGDINGILYAALESAPWLERLS